MSFDDRLVNEINEKIVLSDYIGRQVSLTRRGREFIGLCPFHKEKTPSFTINDDKNFYHCFGCGEHGSVINFLMKYQNLDFIESIKILSKELGLDIQKYNSEYKKYPLRELENIKNILNLSKDIFIKNISSSSGEKARIYLANRKLSNESLIKFELGYAEKYSNNLLEYMKQNSFSEDFLMRSGVIGKSEKKQSLYDFFRNRLVFPIHNHRGELIAFGGRSLDGSEPKYLNSPDTVLFKKRQTLYNFHRAKSQVLKDKTNLIVVEGYMDVISMAQAGLQNVVAPLGTSLSEEQLILLWKVCDEPLICMDGDNAGYRSAVRTLNLAIPILKPGKSLSFVFLPDGEDPDSILEKHKKAAMQKLLENSVSMFDFCWKIEFDYSKLDTPESRAGFRARFEKKISAIKDYSVRTEYKNSFNLNYAQIFNSYNNMFKANRSKSINYNKNPIISNVNFLKRNSSENISYSREKNLILAIINNPSLLIKVNEEFSKIPIINKKLSEIRSLLIDKFVSLKVLQEADTKSLSKFIQENDLVKEIHKEEKERINRLIPPYVKKNKDIELVEVGWREAANLQNIWYKKNKLKKY